MFRLQVFHTTNHRERLHMLKEGVFFQPVFIIKATPTRRLSDCSATTSANTTCAIEIKANVEAKWCFNSLKHLASSQQSQLYWHGYALAFDLLKRSIKLISQVSGLSFSYLINLLCESQ